VINSDDPAWHRLHPLSPLVRAGRGLSGLLVVGVLLFVHASGTGSNDTSTLIRLAIIPIVAVAGLISWLVTRWRIEAGTLHITTGLVRRKVTQVPLSRIQSIDVVRPGAARLFGLAELRVRTGGAHDGDARLAYLAGEQAEALRVHLLDLSRGRPEALDYGSDRPLAAVNNRRLVVALLIRGETLIPVTVAVGLLLAGTWFSRAGVRSSLFAIALVMGIGVVTAIARELNSQLGYEVAEAPEGLRVRGGLVGTVIETIPRHRIQAVQLVEPLWWRPFGWARLQADVAGGQRRQGEDRSASKQFRALLPVATRTQATALLANLLPGLDEGQGTTPPSQARFKAPLRYHFLSAAVAGGRARVGAGRVRRVTTWVSLSKVQSVRWVQGPVQRRMGLATVSLDVAGRRVSLSMRDRGYREGRELVEELPLLCREARELAKVGGGGSQNASAPPDSPAHLEPEPPPATGTVAG
jgi:putative membrane protein